MITRTTARLIGAFSLVLGAALIAGRPAQAIPTSAPAALPYQCPESKDFVLMIHVDGAFARSLNTWSAPPVGRLLKFQCYRAVGRDTAAEWAYIEYGNAVVWVHRNDFRVKEGAQLETLRALVPADLLTPTPVAVVARGVPQVSKEIKERYKKAVAAGRAADIVAVVGDCNSEPPVFFGRMAAGMVNLSQQPELWYAARFFSPSFNRPSQATHGSFSAGMAFDPAWSNPAVCDSDGPLACELKRSNASIVVIALGTGDTFTWRDFEAQYRKIIDYAVKNNVVPVLMTKADALETQQGGASADFINATVRKIGTEYGLPVIDFAAAAKSLPNAGLVEERTTEGKVIEPFHINELAMDTRMVMTLQTLAQIAPQKPEKATPRPRAPRKPLRTPTPNS